MGRPIFDHPPCIVCGFNCGSQTEHLGEHEDNPRAYWSTCSGCGLPEDGVHVGEIRFVHISARSEGVRRG